MRTETDHSVRGVSEPLSPIEMVVLQGTPYCNLNCSYCDLSTASRKQRHVMSLDTIEHLFKDIFSRDLHARELSVVWHSGEPLTLPADYYQRAIDLIKNLRDTLAVGSVDLFFDFQTNATLISDDWIALFRTHGENIRLGVSCDGPAHIHDAYRSNWGGKPTHAKVLRGMTKLRDNGVKFKVIAVVTEATLADPDGFMDFFEGWFDCLNGFHFNILADGSSAANPKLHYSRDDRADYYQFYRHLLERNAASSWIQNFTQAIDRVLTENNDLVRQASRPARTVNVDAHGVVTAFYAGLDPQSFSNQYGDQRGLSLGKIGVTSLSTMLAGEKLQRIHTDFKTSQDQCRSNCHYYQLCTGGFELSQLSEHGSFCGGETKECKIIVKTLMDAVLDNINDKAPMSIDRPN